ncbi:MBL fold metallo-hydrolase [Allopontixanthobacter sp.]|uniref:MBL fold metallo-hydrolase n=1 Tax=Allopontixanthobacter sp. TaxID=2906452 RepID=UPI002ABB05C5|nr:MBL fold metallo-hydrolase [Allopontixanthobacter sp.]MDZ4307019.1 MBL fold metallo-hydrolase [Allopontixanthobacter sp.]
MTHFKRLALASAMTLGMFGCAAPAQSQCAGTVSLQILGSGGPVAEGHRAGTSAIVWVDGKAALLVDAGSGAFVRYGESGAKFTDHQAILITHFHADHVADLDAILNSGGFANRAAPLPIVGPSGDDLFPGIKSHLTALFDEQTGAFRYLSGYLDGRYGLPVLEVTEVDVTNPALQTVFEAEDLKVSAVAVHHGDLPALAYLVESGGKSVIFAGDQSFLSQEFVQVFRNFKPDILVMHNVIPEGDGQPRGLHRWPGSIGEAAAAIQPKKLVLAHNMERALARQEEGEEAIRQSYRGPLEVADDLGCFPL